MNICLRQVINLSQNCCRKCDLNTLLLDVSLWKLLLLGMIFKVCKSLILREIIHAFIKNLIKILNATKKTKRENLKLHYYNQPLYQLQEKELNE